jgi:hypothetical protein
MRTTGQKMRLHPLTFTKRPRILTRVGTAQRNKGIAETAL